MKNSLALIFAILAMMFNYQSVHAQTIGNYTSHSVDGNNIVFKCSSGATVKIELCKPDVARVRMAVPSAGFIPNEPYIVVKYDWPLVKATVKDAGSYIKITTDAMVVRANKNPFSLDFYEKDNATLITRQNNSNSMGWRGDSKLMTFVRDASGIKEHFYGCGMHFEYFDLRGLNMLNFQVVGNRRDLSGASESVNPFYWSTGGYGMLLHNSYKSSFDFGNADSSQIGWKLTNGELDFYFLKGPSFKKMIQSYCDLTGYLELPPKFALGLTYRAQGNNGFLVDTPVYLSAKDVDSVATALREHGVPCDIIATEPGWAPGYGNIVFLKDRFPDPKGWATSMLKKNLQPNLWMRGAIQDPELLTLLDPYLVKPRNFVDATNEKGMDAYFAWLKANHFDIGITAGYKEDTHGRFDTSLVSQSGVSLKQYHNSYWYIWAQGLFKRYKETYNKRFFFFECSLYTGAQRYPIVGYSDLGTRIPWITNSGWTGMAYTPELQRWSGPETYKALHSVALTPYMVQNEWIFGKLPWDTDPHSYDVYLKYVRLHYRLIPYIYSELWEQHKTGVGPIRPLPLEYQDDPQTYAIANQYFYGRNLMVSFDHSTIYLPKGKWTYYWDGRTFDGGRTLQGFNAPDDELPIFVRDGAIIPMMPDMNFVGEKPVDPLILDIYPEGTSTFTLYEDDGISFDYEKGNYCETSYQAVRNKDNVTINISARKAPGAYMPSSRNYLLKIHNSKDPMTVYKYGKALARKTSETELNSSNDCWCYADGIIQVRFVDTGKAMQVSFGK